jgi:3-methylfumaryl-CoA hydratase
MWAGNRLEFHHPLYVGESITRISRILDVHLKEGRTGPLVFVSVRHEVSNAAGLALVEGHDIVYRGPAAVPTEPPSAPCDAVWQREIRTDEVFLFRYSALTFNGHRIHYDRRYATEEEGYPGLVVHGPLIATLLLDLLRRNLPEATLKWVQFRAVSPLFDISSFRVCGKRETNDKAIRLWAQNEAGALAMDATAKIR